jgi:5'-methylthioadenosine phosphorylase
LPSEINNRANLWAFKSLGVQTLVSVSAVGSMKLAYRPQDIVLPTQFIDWTRRRETTFFGDGLVAHVSMAQPVCPDLRAVLASSCRAAGATVHDGGVYLCMEGPQFSSRAESELYRRWDVDVIGMTNAPEAKLAREAEICYATLAMITDYDCWHDEEEAVSVDAVLAALRRNAAMAQEVVRGALRALPGAPGCGCRRALASALITDPAQVPAATRRRLALLVDKYLGPAAASP